MKSRPGILSGERRVFIRTLDVALIFVLLAALALVTWFLPEEETLGGLLRVVFIHGALVRTGQLAFLVAGILSAAYLFWKQQRLIDWAWAIEIVAIMLWLGYFVSSIVTMTQAWGGINWDEPRFQAASQTLVAAVVGAIIAFVVAKPRVTAVISILVAAIVLGLIYTAGLELHPSNPIGESKSASLRISYYAITILVLLLSVQMARLLKRFNNQ
jgi:uncharacterized membrane protein (DUF106 family)